MEAESENDTFEYKEKADYTFLIMENIKNFYDLSVKPADDDRDEKIVFEINNMMRKVEIFEDKDIIEKEFKEIRDFLKGRGKISHDCFMDLMHKIAIVCQRIWHRRHLLLTPVPYQEDIYKDVHDEWVKIYPDKYKEVKKDVIK